MHSIDSTTAIVNSHTNNSYENVAISIARLEGLIAEQFPESVNLLKIALAVIAVSCIEDNSLPTTLVFVGPPSAGKGLALSFVMPACADDPLNEYLYRSDKFTAASFVSHRADLKQEQLAKEIDLLPKIKGKTLITKELSPFFHGKTPELEERFSILTSVLDGQGFISDSGAQGRRGYQEPINFQWLGATTPLCEEAHRVMANLGPRIVFYSADRPEKGIDELVEFASHPDHDKKRKQCQEEARRFIVEFFKLVPRASVQSGDILFSGERVRQLVLWAKALVALRADAAVGAVEQPERILIVLKNIAIGSALIHGRSRVDDYDLAQIGHIALSSGVSNRGKVFGAVLKNGGSATTPQIVKLTRLTTPTVLKYMRELETVGLAHFTDSDLAAHVELLDEYKELCSAPTL